MKLSEKTNKTSLFIPCRLAQLREEKNDRIRDSDPINFEKQRSTEKNECVVIPEI